MIDWAGKVAWFGGVAAASGTLATLLAQSHHRLWRDLFVALVAIAAISFVGLLVTGPLALMAAWRAKGRHISQPITAPPAPVSPVPRNTGADQAAEKLALIEENREHDRMRPLLEGRILPWPGRSDGREHRLEIRVKSHQPLALIVLRVPGNAWFSSSAVKPPANMDFLVQFPEAGRTSGSFSPGHPASCPVRVAANAAGSVTAYAKCRDDFGRTWENIEVAITPEAIIPGIVQGSGGPASGPSGATFRAGAPIVLRGGPMSGREVLHGSHLEDYVANVGGTRHAWRHTDPQAWAPPDRTRPVYDYVGPVD